MRKSFSLQRKNGDEWLFERHGDSMRVFDADDALVDTFTHDQAASRFDTPSFWRSVKDITFQPTKRELIHFEPEPDDVRTVKQYLDDAMMWGGVGAMSAYRTRAWLAVVGGVVLFLGSGVAAFLIDEWARQGGANRVNIRAFMVGIIVGVILFVWGIAGVLRATRLINRCYDEADEM